MSKLFNNNPIVKSWFLVLATACLSGLLVLIPPFEAFGIRFHKCDLFGFVENTGNPSEEAFKANVDELAKQLEEFENSRQEVVDSVVAEILPIHEWTISVADTVNNAPGLDSLVLANEEDVIPIEDFDETDTSALKSFATALLDKKPVKIAFMGDSFIEGDIFTSDLRSLLQSRFGGSGVGFIPCDIPFKIYNKSVRRTSRNWMSYSIMKIKSAPENMKDKFIISGYPAYGKVGSTTSWEDLTCGDNLPEEASIYFIPVTDCSISVNVNDESSRTFDVKADKSLNKITVQTSIKNISMTVESGEIICYGVYLADPAGVRVDNYSVRSNNGHAIFGTNPVLNKQLDEMEDYDMVILQYGLNIMQEGVLTYSKYAQQLKDMITYVRKCFPEASVVVIGVSDRWIKQKDSEEYKPIGSAEALTSYQRKAAKESNVAFWDTYSAMRKIGGVPVFVGNGWMAEDHTHINYKGGNAFARMFFDALCQSVAEASERRREAMLQAVEAAALDSLMRENAILKVDSTIQVIR